MQFIDLKAQYRAYKREIDIAIRDTLENTAFILGPTVASLEQELAEFCGSRFCISCASGTDALLIALMAAGVGQGDEVIVPAFSFFATAETVSLVGATPVFVDIDPVTFNLDPARIEAAVSDRSRAIIPVGLYGQAADMDEINQVAGRAGLTVIEDAAQSFGAKYADRTSGTLGHIGCTSFYPAKPLGGYGDGGAVFTDDEASARACREIMNHGQVAGYTHNRIGLNARLDAMQAAILRVKLVHFADEKLARESCAERYNHELESVEGLELPQIVGGRTSTYAQYTLRSQQRDSLRNYLSERGIPTAVHYPTPIFAQTAYASLGETQIEKYRAACPQAERACQEVLSLPFGPFLDRTDQEQVIGALSEFNMGETV